MGHSERKYQRYENKYNLVQIIKAFENRNKETVIPLRDDQAIEILDDKMRLITNSS